MYRSIKEDSHEIYFVFFWVLLYFYRFLKFLWFSRNVKENGKNENRVHSVRPASAHGLKPNGVAARLTLLATRLSGPVRAAQPRPEWPGHRTRRSACTARGHHRVSTRVAPWPTPVEEWRSKAHHNGGSTASAESGRCDGGWRWQAGSGGRQRASVGTVARGWDGEWGGADGGGRRWSEVGAHCEGVEAAAVASTVGAQPLLRWHSEGGTQDRGSVWGRCHTSRRGPTRRSGGGGRPTGMYPPRQGRAGLTGGPLL
jgi:hypothetical protein